MLVRIVYDGIGLLGDGNGDLIGDRVDLQIAVRHFHVDILVVRGSRGEVRGGETHRVGVGVRAGGDGLADERYLRIGRVARDGVALDGLLLAVVSDGLRAARDLHDDALRRGDLQRTVHDHELDVRKVAAGVLKVARFDAHRVLADIRSLRRPRRGLRFGDVLLHVVERVIRGHGLVALDGVLLRVVNDRIGVLGNGDGDLVADGVDLQRAVHDHELDVREVFAGVPEVAGDDADRVFARVGPLRRPRLGRLLGDVLLHVVERVVRGHGLVAGDGVLRAVIGDGGGVLGDGHGDLIGDRIDLEPAVLHDDLDIAVVPGGDAEAILRQTHIIGVNVGALRFCLDAILQRNVDRLRTDVCRVVGDGLFLAVIHLGVVVAGDGDGDLIRDRRDLQQTVFHDDKLYRREVLRVVVHEALGLEIHVILADVRALGMGALALREAEVRPSIRAVADANDRVAVHFVLAAVVDHAVADALDLHDHGSRSDNLEIAVSVGDLIVIGHVVAASIQDVRVVFVRHQNAGVLAHCGPAAGDDRFHTVTIDQIGDGVARAGLDLAVGGQAHAVRLAVINDGVVRGFQNDLLFARAALGDGERAGDECDGLELIVHDIARCVRDGHNGDLVIVLRAVRNVLYRADDRRRQREASGRQLLALARGHGICFAVVANGVAAVGVLLAVILPGAAVRRDGDDLLVLRNGQRAVRIGDIVVLGLRVALQRVAGDLVGAAADSRLAALDRDARKTLFAHEAAVADGVAAVGERRAVVRLGGAVRRQLDRHRRDGERADDGIAEGVVGGHVRAVRTLHTVGLIFVPLGAHVGQTGVGRELHDQPVAFRQRSGMRGLVVQQLFAVILSAFGRRGDDDSVRALRDGELAGDLGDIVVLLAEGRARRIGDSIFDRAVGHISHAAGGRDAGHLAGDEAVTRDGDIRTGQRRAVVFLARGLGRERHGARQNGQLAVHTVGKGVVARNVCAAAHDLITLDDVLALVAHVRGAALNNSRQHVAGHQHTFGAAEAVVRERRSVVLFAAARRGDGDGLFGDGGDGESAVRNGEHDVRKVLACIREVAGDDTHRVLADVRALRRPRHGLRFGDVLLHVVERVVRRHGLIAGDGVLLPVIHGGAGFLGDGDGDLIGDRIDLQPAVRHFHLDVLVVRGSRGEVGGLETHRVGAGVRAGSDGLADERHGRVCRVARDGIALDGLHLAVVGDGLRVARDLHNGDARRGDDQIAVHDHELDVREVAAGVLKVGRFDADMVGADIHSLRRPRRGLGRTDAGGHVVERVVRRYGLVARDGVLLPVIGDGVGFLGDGDGNFLGDRIDLQIAVHYNDLDVAVVLGRDGEVFLRQAHVVLAGVHALRFRLGAFLQRDGNGLLADVRRVARDGLLAAVIDQGVMVAGDGDDDFGLVRRDRQRAGLIGRQFIVAAGQLAALEPDGGRIDVVRHAADIGDGALLRHGEGDIRLLIAVDKALDLEVRLRERLGVVGSARALCGDRQRNGVVNGDDVPRRFHFQRLAGGVAVRMRRRIFRTQRGRGARRQRIADRHGAGLVGSDLHFRTLEVMVDGVPRGVALEVQLQRQRAVRGHDTGFDVVLIGRIVHIRGHAVSLVFIGDGNGGVRRAGARLSLCERVGAVGLLAVELDLIGGIVVRLPLRVEDVRVDAGHAGKSAERKARAAAVGGGVPAGEGVARAGEDRALERHLAVVGDLFLRHGALRAAVRHIHEREDALGIAPDGIERDARVHAQLVVGLVLDRPARRFRPAEEHLALGNGEGVGLHVGVRTGGIALHIRDSILAVSICHGVAALIGIVGVKLDILVNFGAEVEGRVSIAVLRRPASKCPALARRLLRIGEHALVNGAAVGDGEILLSAGAFHGDVGNAADRGRYPVGVHRDVLRAHRAGEAMGMLSGRVVVPAEEDVFLLADGRRRRGLVRRSGDGLLVENALAVRGDLAAAVHVYNIVGVAGVIESGVVVFAAGLRADTGVECKAGDGVLVLASDRVAGAGGSIGMMQLVGLAADSGRPALAGQDFDIIVCRFRAAPGFRSIECGAVQRHRIDVDLIGAAAITLRCPRAASVVGGPLIADGRAIFGGDAQVSILL